MAAIDVPVFSSFQNAIDGKPIGRLSITDAELLPKDFKFCFALAYKVSSDTTPNELLYVAVSRDESYLRYLKREYGETS